MVWHEQEKNWFGILICGKFYVWFDIKQEKNSFLIPPNSCFGGFTIPSKMVGFGKNSFRILPFDQNTSDSYSKHNRDNLVNSIDSIHFQLQTKQQNWIELDRIQFNSISNQTKKLEFQFNSFLFYSTPTSNQTDC